MNKEIKAFARHETFFVRYGWLTKIALNKKSLYENNDYAEIGVGKNMFNSMKYWGLAYKIIAKEEENKKSNKTSNYIFEKDPFLERTESLWILHYESILKVSYIPCWRGIFNFSKEKTFTQASLEKEMVNYFTTIYPEVSQKSILKDVNCFIQTFVFKSNNVDDSKIKSPFAELGILEENATNANTYNFVIGKKESLKPEVLLWATVRYMEENNYTNITFEELANSIDGPGLIFKLDETSIESYLTSTEVAKHKGVFINESIGKKIISVDSKEIDSMKILEKVYK